MHGTTPSGDTTSTTWGNTLRMSVRILYILDVAGITDFVLVVGGDDVTLGLTPED